ncbi:MAG: ornithine carbamoyltransferase [Chloroflexota bacterium]|nr:ornithine carbamoyltransferase [Chloroflexota bacterium]
MKGRDLISIADLTPGEVHHLIERALALKAEGPRPILEGKALAILFEKPSLRTRVSFDVGIRQLGGHPLYLSPAEVGLGQREPVADVARVLSRYVDGIIARTFAHRTVELLASHASVPVINALSDAEHPCQVLSDLLTMYQKKGRLEGLAVAYIGDANNVATSLLLACSMLGMELKMASPPGYGPTEELMARAQGGRVTVTEDPREAARGADVVYTDVWTSMGQEAEAQRRRQAFARYQVDAALLALAREDALFMHPLPAHHGEEIAEGLLDVPQSVVFDQAENRLHMQKALLAELMA